MKRKHTRFAISASMSLTLLLLGLCFSPVFAQIKSHRPEVTFVAKSVIPGAATRSRSQHRLNLSMPTFFEGDEPSVIETRVFMMTKYQVAILEVKDGDPSKIQIDCKAARNNSLVFGAGPVTNHENPEFKRLVGRTLVLEELPDTIAAMPRDVKPGEKPFWGPMRARFTKRSRAQAWFPSAATLFDKREFKIGQVVQLNPTAVEEFFQLPARVSKCKNSTFTAKLSGITTRKGVQCGIFDVTISAIDARTGSSTIAKQRNSMNLECKGTMIIGVSDLFLYEVDLAIQVSAWANGKDKPRTLYGDATIKISHAQTNEQQQFDSVALTESDWQTTRLASKKKDPVKVTDSTLWSGTANLVGSDGKPRPIKSGSFDVNTWSGKQMSSTRCRIENDRWMMVKRRSDRITITNIIINGRRAELVDPSSLSTLQFPEILRFRPVSGK